MSLKLGVPRPGSDFAVNAAAVCVYVERVLFRDEPVQGADNDGFVGCGLYEELRQLPSGGANYRDDALRVYCMVEVPYFTLKYGSSFCRGLPS